MCTTYINKASLEAGDFPPRTIRSSINVFNDFTLEHTTKENTVIHRVEYTTQSSTSVHFESTRQHLGHFNASMFEAIFSSTRS